ncbi:sugar-binding transcriptional regulator [Paracoccus tegillarcae]|uniref:DNA-binding transcriptional regulator n=1 Tax=Paracoccus tegillarcae TaxID=1529068 RepID=A0A2K9EDH9_9RHOB|nr:sugar-binding transcriptional regulator [Paracoccus tegillarcae]AUH32990.1 DNA-binding transcriptional regulator [Paracoccus tegillarcae]
MSVEGRKLDQIARAAWLSFVAGQTQDEIAAQMGVSRQSVQRMVAQAQAMGLVKVRIDHPFADCLDLSVRLKKQAGLAFCEVVPSDPAGAGMAIALADCIEGWLKREEPLIAAFGTGRTLRAGVERMSRLECDQHRLVSLTGNIATDGSTAYYNVLFSLSERVTARSYPLLMPVVASSAEERQALAGQAGIARVIEMAEQAAVAFLGIGTVNDDAALVLDGFATAPEIAALREAGAVGEITGWAYDAEGRLLDDPLLARVASAPIPARESALVIAAATGKSKRAAIQGALAGGLVNGLITDTETAEFLLK